MTLARFTLYLLWTVLSLVFIALVVMTVALTAYDKEIEGRIADKIYESTGRQFQIAKGFSFRFTPRPTLIAHDIRLGNAEWGSTPWMLSLDSVKASLSVTALLAGEIKILGLKGEQPTMLIEKQGDKVNWSFNRERPKKVFEKLAKYLVISNARINNGMLHIRADGRAYDIAIDSITGTTHWFGKDIELHAIGSTNNVPIDLTLIADDFQTMLLREPTRLSLVGSYGESKLGATGLVDDLLKWQGLNLELQVDAPTLTVIQPWVETVLPETPAITVNARFVQPKRWASASFEDVHLVSNKMGGVTEVTGRIDKIKGWDGIDLIGQADYKTKPVFQWKKFTVKESAKFGGEFKINGGRSSGIRLTVDGKLRGQGFDGVIKGEIGDILQANSDALAITLNVDSLHQLAPSIGRKWPKTQALIGRSKLQKLGGRWGLTELTISKAIDGTSIAKGQLLELGPKPVGQIDIDLSLLQNEIKQYNQQNKSKLPEVDNAQIRGELIVKNQLISAQNVRINLSSGDNSLEASGDVTKISNLSINTFKLTANAPNITKLNQLYDSKLPDLGRLQATARLEGSLNNGYGLFDVEGAISDDIGTSNEKDRKISSEPKLVQFEGKMTQLGKGMRSTLKLSSTDADIRGFQSLSEITLPKNIQASGTAVLSSQSASDWTLAELAVDLVQDEQFSATLLGEIAHMPAQTQVHLEVEVDTLSQTLLKQLLKRDLPQFTSLSGSGTLRKAYQEPIKVEELSVQLQNKSAMITAEGQVNQLTPSLQAQLNMKLKAEDSRDMPYLDVLASANSDIPATALIRLDIREDKVINNIKILTLGSSQLSGNLIWHFQGRGEAAITKKNPKGLAQLVGALDAKRIDIKQLFKKDKRTRLFSQKLLQLDWAKTFNSNIKVRVSEFEDHSYRMHNLRFNAELTNGFIRIPDVISGFGSGQIVGWLSVDTNGDQYNALSALHGLKLTPNDFNLPDKEYIEHGTFDIDLGIAGQGNTIAEIMDSAFGKFKLTLNDAAFKNTKLEVFGSDLIFGLLNKINPLRKKNELLEIECGVIHFPIVNGIAKATRGIAIKTKRFTVLGGGTIDLGNENINLLIRPKPRTGFGLSLSSVAQLVQLGGQIGTPKIEIGKSGLLEASANIGVAVLTGGWSLLAKGLLDRTQANADVCEETSKHPDLAEVVDLGTSLFHDSQKEGGEN